jgi:hypothetical protein
MSGHRDSLIEAIQLATNRLLLYATQQDIVVSGDLRVNERAAARLLGYSAGHLKAMRLQGNGPRFYAIGLDGGRFSYRLDDLASWVEMGTTR